MLVSIVIPVFNQSEYLPQAIESALGQDLRDILPGDSVDVEIIVVDDKSTDRSLRVAQDFQKRFEDHCQKQRQGTFDYGRDQSWSEERIEAALAAIRNPIKVVAQPQNMGLSAARNAGISATYSKNGYDLILPLDADDWIEPNYLKKTV